MALLTGWLSSSSHTSFARTIYSTIVNLVLGYVISWFSTTSLVHTKLRSAAPPGSFPLEIHLALLPLGLGSWLVPFTVCYGAEGVQKMQAPSSFPYPAPLPYTGQGVFFGILCPWPHLGPRPTHIPEWYPLKIVGNTPRPFEGICDYGPPAGAGWRLPTKYPYWPCIKTRPGW